MIVLRDMSKLAMIVEASTSGYQCAISVLTFARDGAFETAPNVVFLSTLPETVVPYLKIVLELTSTVACTGIPPLPSQRDPEYEITTRSAALPMGKRTLIGPAFAGTVKTKVTGAVMFASSLVGSSVSHCTLVPSPKTRIGSLAHQSRPASAAPPPAKSSMATMAPMARTRAPT